MSADDVTDARRRHRQGEPVSVIAPDFGVSTTVIYHLLKGMNYRDVPDHSDHTEPPVRPPRARIDDVTAYRAYWRHRAGASYHQLARDYRVSAMGIRGAVLRIPETGPGAPFPAFPPTSHDDTGAIHGTPRGRLAHEHEGTEPCEPCRAAWADFNRQCEARAQAAHRRAQERAEHYRAKRREWEHKKKRAKKNTGDAEVDAAGTHHNTEEN